jgi:hypothetical protein
VRTAQVDRSNQSMPRDGLGDDTAAILFGRPREITRNRADDRRATYVGASRSRSKIKM